MSVHNHPPYRPMCNERRLPDGQLRGACLDDDGTSVIPPTACPMCGSVAGYSDGPPCLTCHYDIPPDPPRSPAMSHDHRGAIAALLDRHLSDRDFEQGCRLACGYDGDDRSTHLADALLGSDVLAQIRAEARAEALRESADELKRLASIGKTPFDEIPHNDWQWFRTHPIRGNVADAHTSAVIPDLCKWLRDRAEGSA